MINKTKPDYNIQIVGYALDILEQFHDGNTELGLTELCRRLKLQKNRVFRLLATLESQNFIEQDKITSTYRLGMKNLRLRQAFVKQGGLTQHARPVLENLTRKSKETSYVAIMKDYHLIYLDAIESALPLRVVPSVGKMLPFHCMSAGKVLAAGLSDKSLLEYCRHSDLKKFTLNTIDDPKELTIHLRSVAEMGYAVGNEEFEIGAKCVGMPIRDYTKNIIGAVSVSGPSTRFTARQIANELIPALKDAAEELSFKLGYA